MTNGVFVECIGRRDDAPSDVYVQQWRLERLYEKDGRARDAISRN